MAASYDQNKKKSTSRSSSKNTKKTTKKQSEQYIPRVKTEQEKMNSKELSLLIIFAVTILLFLCNFGIIGPVGNAVSGFLFGIFGLLAYIAPVFLFLVIAFGISNQGNVTAMLKMTAAVILFFIAGILSHVS